jgi:predicted porin
MKKTLIALAALAASGASFAQVTMTGNVGFGFEKSASQTDSNANTGSGMTTVDGTINFAAKEDLGGGMSIVASTEFQLRGRTDATPSTTSVNGNSFRPRNAIVTLTTPVGVLSMGSIESPSGFFRTTSYTDSWRTGFDSANGPWDGKTNIDYIRYIVPVGKTLLLSAWYSEIGAGIGNNVIIGTTSTKMNAPTLMVNYTAGPITAYADYTVFSAQRATGIPSTIHPLFDGLNRYRVGADYNFGMAKVSLGYQTRDHELADQFAFGLTVPLGATTLNLTYGHRENQKAAPKYGIAAADVERTGTALQVRYNFSKLTMLEGSYAVYTGGAKIANGERDLSDEYRIRLNKAF